MKFTSHLSNKQNNCEINTNKILLKTKNWDIFLHLLPIENRLQKPKFFPGTDQILYIFYVEKFLTFFWRSQLFFFLICLQKENKSSYNLLPILLLLFVAVIKIKIFMISQMTCFRFFNVLLEHDNCFLLSFNWNFSTLVEDWW